MKNGCAFYNCVEIQILLLKTVGSIWISGLIIQCVRYIWMIRTNLIYIYPCFCRSLCEDCLNAEWKTVAQEKDVNQKMHLKSLLQRILLIWSAIRAHSGNNVLTPTLWSEFPNLVQKLWGLDMFRPKIRRL